MASPSKMRDLHRALMDRVLVAKGQVSRDQRLRAFNNTGVPEQWRSLVEKGLFRDEWGSAPRCR